MKKGRPGQLLRVIARQGDAERLGALVLAHSTALGVRCLDVPRLLLSRELRRVQTRFGRIAVKRIEAPGGRVYCSAEYEDCARAARRHEVPLAEVVREAERAAEQLEP
jgi:uncharacterized protein (DUF111 family)